MRKYILLVILLLTTAFSLAPWLQVRLQRGNNSRDGDNVFKIFFGEGRRMFANQMVVQADVYMHSGLYPSIFDQAAAKKEYADEEGRGGGKVATESAGNAHEHDAEAHDDHDEDEHHDASFLGDPHDWIEAEGRHFMVTKHTHLAGGREREILPWLKLSAELDPQRIETYTVTAYWLADRLHETNQAVNFLRDGLRANPNSYEILFELGRLYAMFYHQPDRARNLWHLALRRWDEVEARQKEPDKNGKGRILVYLAELEFQAGNYAEAIHRFEEAKAYSPQPEALDDRIKEVRAKAGAAQGSLATPPH
ncbi:MAG TPA: hypothetical protein VFV96_05245 [Verrucomicrobiae bacterium]|nr:hypothetical protein [Verrucomicrobiae bacterium]